MRSGFIDCSKVEYSIDSSSSCCVCAHRCALQISNYAKPGHRSRHNQVYWHCQPYYAFGLGAASYARGRRFTRPRVMKEYDGWVQGFVASGAGCPAANLPPESKVRDAGLQPIRVAARRACCSSQPRPRHYSDVLQLTTTCAMH